MAIFRCNKCGFIREVGNDLIGKSVKCPDCEEITSIYDTVPFIKAIIKKFIVQNKELQSLRHKSSEDETDNQDIENISFKEIDIHNTNTMSQAANLEPILKWFEKHKIQVRFKQDSTDTTGFFDEIALLLGNQFEVLNCVSSQIKYAQNKDYSNAQIDVSKRNPKEVQQIITFCKELYDYSFVSKYFYQKKEKVIRLNLQKAQRIREFFNGIWMEWFVLMILLEFFRVKKIAPSCTRSLGISFDEKNSNELDLFILTEKNIPVLIECKSGEFRQDINKYLSLRKRLGIPKNQFILCVFGLSEEQTKGMTSMYELTFVNEKSLIDHIKTVI